MVGHLLSSRPALAPALDEETETLRRDLPELVQQTGEGEGVGSQVCLVAKPILITLSTSAPDGRGEENCGD